MTSDDRGRGLHRATAAVKNYRGAVETTTASVQRFTHELAHHGEGMVRGCPWCAEAREAAGYRP